MLAMLAAAASAAVPAAPAAPVPAGCNPAVLLTCTDAVVGAVVKGKSVTDAVSKIADFASDPMGYIAGQMQHGATGLAEGVLPALNEATRPDLSMDWFVSAYRVSFALAVFVWVLMLIWSLVQYMRKKVAGNEVVDSLALYSPLFIIGAMFGPAIGQFLVRFVGVINDDLIAWGVGSTAKETSEGLMLLISTGTPETMIGGSIVAALIYFFMILGLMMAVVTLLIMLVTLYLSGVVFPLGWVWLTKAGDRSRGMKIVMVWAGVLCAQPLLFLLLGAAMSMASGMSVGGQSGSKPLTILVGLVTAVIALFMAGLSPVALAKFAPVGPTDATPGGPGARMPSGGGGGSWRGGGGAYSPTNSQTSQIAQANAGAAGGSAATSAAGSGVGGGGGGAVLGPAGMAVGAAAGGIAAAAAAMKRQAQGAEGSAESAGGTSPVGAGAEPAGGTSPVGAGAEPAGGTSPVGMGSAGGAGATPGADSSGIGSSGAGAPGGSGQGPSAGGAPQGGGDRAGGAGAGSRVGAGAGANAGAGSRSGAHGGAKAGNAVSDLAQRTGAYAERHMDHQQAGGGPSGASRSGAGAGPKKAGNAVSDLAQRAADHAAGHMDHQDGPKR